MMKQSNNRRQSRQQATKPRACFFCTTIGKIIDYKDANTLRKFTSSFGKIVPRRKSGVCATHQRKLANAIKRARVLSILPYVAR